MGWREDRLHRWLLRLHAEAPGRGVMVGAPGHDAAVLRRSGGRPVVCVDQTLEGVHFHPETAAARVGRKAVDRALSDLAATAASPRAVLLALTAPAATTEAWMKAAIRGVRDRAQAFGAFLVGGDLAAAEGRRALTVTALGELIGRRSAPARSRARPGDLVVLTGPVGGSSLGRHLALEPRVAEGRFLHELGARALIDVSDGLALDLRRVATASGVRIDLHTVPVHADAVRLARESGREAREHALGDGEDHELVATVPPAARARIERAAGGRFPRMQVVGVVRRGRGLRVADAQGRLIAVSAASAASMGGWVHGS